MPDKAWKAFERRIATSLSTVRTPLSGEASRHTSSDTLHPDLYVECRQRKTMAVHSWFTEARTDAAIEDKQPMLALHKKGTRIALAVINWDFFIGLWEAYLYCTTQLGYIPEPKPNPEKE